MKDAKKLKPKDIEHTMEVLEKLCKNQTLEPKYNDHALRGDLQGARDCHIKLALVLIYMRDKEVLDLIDWGVGKHSKVLE